MLVRVYDNAQRNAVNVWLPKAIFGKMGRVVIKIAVDGALAIRHATDCEKALAVNEKRCMVCFSHEYAKDYIGAWLVEKDGDYYYLTQKVA